MSTCINSLVESSGDYKGIDVSFLVNDQLVITLFYGSGFFLVKSPRSLEKVLMLTPDPSLGRLYACG